MPVPASIMRCSSRASTCSIFKAMSNWPARASNPSPRICANPPFSPESPPLHGLAKPARPPHRLWALWAPERRKSPERSRIPDAPDEFPPGARQQGPPAPGTRPRSARVVRGFASGSAGAANRANATKLAVPGAGQPSHTGSARGRRGCRSPSSSSILGRRWKLPRARSQEEFLQADRVSVWRTLVQRE